MTISLSSEPPLPRKPRRFWRLVAVAFVALPFVFLLLVLRPASSIPERQVVDAAAAEQARGLADRLQALTDGNGGAAGLSVDEAELNSALAAAARLVPGLGGSASVGPDALRIDLALGAPRMPDGLWLGLHGELAPSDDGLRIELVRVGRLPIPSALAAAALRVGLDIALGDKAGTQLFDSVESVSISQGGVHVAFRTDASGDVPAFRLLRDRALGSAGEGAREEAYAQLKSLDEAATQKLLPHDGSVGPYLRHVIETAAARPGPESDRARGALYALAIYCGDPEFRSVVNVWPSPRIFGPRNGCLTTTLAGRDDLRKHFVISAALDAATSGTAAFGVGELKELLDSNAGGSGFSFDDMAADAAGVRFGRTMLATPASAWRELAQRAGDEDAVLPSLEGLPSGMSFDAFKAEFGSVESPAYRAMVAEIDARVDALPINGAEPVTAP